MSVNFIAAGCAAIISFTVNKLLIKMAGVVTVISFSPIVEEAAKTMLSYWLAADILYVHLWFGVLEGIYDFFTNKRQRSLLFISSAGMHFVCGLVTVTVLEEYNIYYALIAGIVIHWVANNVALTFKIRI